MPFATSFDGTKIHYQVVGQGNKPIFFIMGLGVDMRGWMFQVQHFSKKYKVYLIDNRGVGKTDKPSTPFTTEDMAKDIYYVMQKENVEKANFVGASMGGMILQKFAALFPDKVENLVLACTLAKLTDHEKELIKKGFKFIKGIDVDVNNEEIIKNLLLQTIEADPERIFNFLSKNIFDPVFFEQNKDFIINFFKDYLKDGFSVSGFMKQVWAILNHDSTEDLPKITARTLVITGDADKMVPPEKSLFIHQKIKNSQLKMIKGGSHAFMFERYEEFNHEIEKFIESN